MCCKFDKFAQFNTRFGGGGRGGGGTGRCLLLRIDFFRDGLFRATHVCRVNSTTFES